MTRALPAAAVASASVASDLTTAVTTTISPVAEKMASSENSFFGLKVPEGNDRRELYKSQYRAIYTCKRTLSCTAQHTCRAAR